MLSLSLGAERRFIHHSMTIWSARKVKNAPPIHAQLGTNRDIERLARSPMQTAAATNPLDLRSIERMRGNNIEIDKSQIAVTGDSTARQSSVQTATASNAYFLGTTQDKGTHISDRRKIENRLSAIIFGLTTTPKVLEGTGLIQLGSYVHGRQKDHHPKYQGHRARKEGSHLALKTLLPVH